MINAQKAMREELARSKLPSIAEGVQGKGRPASFAGDVQEWFADRQVACVGARRRRTMIDLRGYRRA
ncbi:hypothetical protein C7E15_19925 [Stenotrophomonas maltophilia]|nr:hypothetical protein C7E15_19925 [Stenotrophomonas maltophilia]